MPATQTATLRSCEALTHPISDMVMDTTDKSSTESSYSLTPPLQIVLGCAIAGVLFAGRLGGVLGIATGLVFNLAYFAKSRLKSR